MFKKRKIPRRTYCEEKSPTLKSIISSKNHGKIITVEKDTYEYIGDNLLYCFKTSRIIKLGSLN